MMGHPFQHVIEAFPIGTANTVEHHHLGGFCWLPAGVKHSPRLLNVRPVEGVVASPENASRSGGVLAPNHPIPCIFPHALVGIGVACCISVGVEFLRPQVPLK